MCFPTYHQIHSLIDTDWSILMITICPDFGLAIVVFTFVFIIQQQQKEQVKK